MDKSKCREIVDQHIKDLMWMLGVQAWGVTVEYEPINRNASATITFDYAYEQATIIIDPDKHDLEETLLKNLRHELIHLILAPFDSYRDLIINTFPKDSQLVGIEHQAAKVATERTVLGIERIFDWGLEKENPIIATTKQDERQKPENAP